MTKVGGVGSISQRNESADPNPDQNVTDPYHCVKCSRNFNFNRLGYLSRIYFRSGSGAGYESGSVAGNESESEIQIKMNRIPIHS
jgi:hypothetical protein